MSGFLAPLNPTEADYETIRLAVMETERGRWFLDEYAKRNRHSDTDSILIAMKRIEGAISQQRETSEMDKFRLDVLEMSRAIARTRDEISAIKPTDGTNGRLTEATDELDSIVAATETATSDILAAAEKVQEAAWTLRENGALPEICEALDELATNIYTSCSFQDLTAQRIRRVIATIDFLEKRVNAMADIWQLSEEEKTAHSPDIDSNAGITIDPAMSQDDVDFVLVNAAQSNHPVEGEAPSTLNVSDDFELDMAFASGSPVQITPLDSAAAERDEAEQSARIDEVLFAQTPDNSAVYDNHSVTDAVVIDDDFMPQDPLYDVVDIASEAPSAAGASDAHHDLDEAAQVETALAKIRSGGELSFAEAAKALDQLKSMSAEDRSHLFRG